MPSNNISIPRYLGLAKCLTNVALNLVACMVLTLLTWSTPNLGALGLTNMSDQRYFDMVSMSNLRLLGLFVRPKLHGLDASQVQRSWVWQTCQTHVTWV